MTTPSLFRHLSLTALLCIMSTAAFSQPELKGNPEELRQFLHPVDRIVSLVGDANEKAYSDKAIVSLVITTEDKLLSNAIASNGQLRSTISERLLAAGIKSAQIKSSTFSTSPEYGWFGKKPASYKVVNRMAITISDERDLKLIAQLADSQEALELSEITFEHSQKDATQLKVKQQALSKVMAQKAFYESSLGVTLTPIGFRDANLGYRATRGALMLEEVIVTASKRMGNQAESADAYSAPRDVSFDEIEYTAEIVVDFKIESGKITH